MAKSLLFCYIIAVTVFAIWPAWLTIAVLLASDSTTWRSWAEAARAFTTGWLFFVIPSLVLYFLIVQLPRAIANRLNTKSAAYQQAELQAKARSLNPQHEGTPLPHAEDSAVEAPEAPLTEETNPGDNDTEDFNDPSPPLLHQILLRQLFSNAPIRSSIRWRLLMSVIGWPILACLYSTLQELLHEISNGPSGYFTVELMVTLLSNLYTTLLPVLGYWLVFEFILHRWPQWFASPARHYPTAILTGLLLACVVQWIDPALEHAYIPTLEFLAYNLHIPVAGICIGGLLALLYRIPVQIDHFFADDPA